MMAMMAMADGGQAGKKRSAEEAWPILSLSSRLERQRRSLAAQPTFDIKPDQGHAAQQNNLEGYN